jgi:hypothetical protein
MRWAGNKEAKLGYRLITKVSRIPDLLRFEKDLVSGTLL